MYKTATHLQIIETDHTPVRLQYVEHLDQVWIVCWNGDRGENLGISSVMVVKEASAKQDGGVHRAEYMEPESNTIAVSV